MASAEAAAAPQEGAAAQAATLLGILVMLLLARRLVVQHLSKGSVTLQDALEDVGEEDVEVEVTLFPQSQCHLIINWI